MICQEGQICAVGDFNITVNGNDAKAKMGGCVPYTEDHCSGPAGCTYIEAQAKETFPFFTVKQQCHVSFQSFHFPGISIFSLCQFKVRIDML